MSILVVGSVAFDNVASPSGKAENLLGGAATFFALAASYFTQVRVVGVVGDDFQLFYTQSTSPTGTAPAGATMRQYINGLVKPI